MTVNHYALPGQLFVGAGAAAKLLPEAQRLGARHVFVLADPGVVRAGLLDPLAASLREGGLPFTVCEDVLPNPDNVTVDRVVRQCAASGANLIVGLGGGSALDIAKAMRLPLAGGGGVDEYAYRVAGKGRTFPTSVLPLVAIPTTAGTGSEATPWSVITDLKAHYKFGVGGTVAIPEVALVDPQLMLGLPPFLTAATGMDALSHLIEAFVSTNINPLLDPLILRGIELAGAQLLAAVRHGTDLTARAAMAQAALLGGIAISSNWLGACHSLSHQLSSFADVQHGLANAIMLPHQMRYSLPAALARYAQVGVALGSPAKGTAQKRAEFAVERVAALARDCGLPLRLRDAGVDAALLAPMAHSAFVNDSNHTTNPRPCTEASLAEMYQAAF